MIRLVALDQEQTQTTLDLEGTPSISLNLAVAKPGETMQRHAPYSQTFRLPFTDRNNVFFAHFYEVTLTDGDFDPTQKTEVLLCLLYTSPSPRDRTRSRMPSSA